MLNIYNIKKNKLYSDLTLENIEALANNESSDTKWYMALDGELDSLNGTQKRTNKEGRCVFKFMRNPKRVNDCRYL